MARRSTSSNNVFILVFSIAFGLLALSLGYQAVMNSTDIRSKAAQMEQIYKQWEFNGSGTEGWAGISPTRIMVKNGSLVFQVPKATVLPAIRNTNASIRVPKGLKKVSIAMAVGAIQAPTVTKVPMPRETDKINSPTSVSNMTDDTAFTQTIKERIGCTEEAKICPDGTSVGRTGPSCEFQPCPTVGVKPSRTMTGSSTSAVRRFTAAVYYKLVNKNRYEKPVTFSGLVDGKYHTYPITLPDIDTINIDKLRIVFTSGIKTGENVSVDWIRVSGTVVKATPTPNPPTGCRYEKVTCVKAPCDPILVCLTPTPTLNIAQETCARCNTNADCANGLTCQPFTTGQGGCKDDGAGHTVCYEPARMLYCAKPDGTSKCAQAVTSTPSVTCKTGVNSFSVDTKCPGGFQYMTFKCYDGFGRREGGPSSCKSSETWSSYAQGYCQGHCPATVTPSTASPIPIGCRYEKVTCVKAPCDPVLVCPITSTIVPLPSYADYGESTQTQY